MHTSTLVTLLICVVGLFCASSANSIPNSQTNSQTNSQKPKRISEHTKSLYKGKDVGVFWHITDPHIDLHYQIGSPSTCDVPLCCRINTTLSNSNTNSNNHANNKYNAKSNKNYSKLNHEDQIFGDKIESKTALPLGTLGVDCDIEHELWRSTLKWIQSSFSEDEPDFIIAGGDWIHHADWQQVPADYIQYAKMITDDMLEIFGKDMPVYPVIGNHDGSNAVNIMPYHGENKEKLLKALDEFWGENWIHDPQARQSLRDWGYYSALVPSTSHPSYQGQKIRVVTLNSQWVNPLNFWVYSSPTDLAMNLQWIEGIFNQSRANGEKILISGHIPPGIGRGDAMPESLNFWNEGFEKLLVEYGDLVIGGLCGHTHQDDFGIFHDYSVHPPRPTMVTFTTPAVTPYGSGYYPTVRKYIFDRTTGELLDQHTYYNNMTQFHSEAKDFNQYWRLEYSAASAWGLKSLSPQEVESKILNRLWANDEKAWQQFGDFRNVLGHRECEGSIACKHNYLCSMTHMNLFNYAKCSVEHWPKS